MARPKSMAKKKPKKISDKELMQRIKERLNVDDCYTYNELINLLEIEKQSGSRNMQLQLNDLSRFMEIEKIPLKRNSKYVILDIYDNYIPKARKLREDAIYTKYVEALLLTYLKSKDGYCKSMTKMKWWVTLSIVGEAYNIYSDEDRRNELLNISDTMDTKNINEFYNRVNQRFTILFYRALDSLTKRSLVKYSRVYKIRYNNDKEYHIATKQETSDILDCERYALDSVKLNTTSQLYIHPELLQPYRKYLKQYEEESYGIKSVYSEIEIIHGVRFLREQLDYTLAELKKIMKDGNNAFYNNAIKEIDTKYNKNKIISDFNDNDSNVLDALYDIDNFKDAIILFNRSKEDYEIIENFVKNQTELADKLIKIKE